MTEMVTLDPQTGSAAAGNGAATLTGSSTFATVLRSEKLASRIIGTRRNRQGRQRAGGRYATSRWITAGVHAYVLRVGGLLGIGERFVAVTPTAIALSLR